MSNMGYLSTLLTADAREKAGPKNGAVSMATVNIDPLGAVTVTADVTVQGQSHETVLAQIVAEQLGLEPTTSRSCSKWTPRRINGRSPPALIRAVSRRAPRSPPTWPRVQMRDKLKPIAAKQLNVLPDDVELAERQDPQPLQSRQCAAVRPRRRHLALVADAVARRHGAGLSETAVWTPPELEPPSNDDRINTSLTYGFIFDMCGVEIDPLTYQVRVDRYVSMHDAGRILNPTIAEGQIRGAFAQGIAAALYEEFTYNEEGAFLSGTFADYLVPTASEIPEVEILHMKLPSPFTPLGAKGLAEGNCMSAPACIANAIADALGVNDVPCRRRRGASTP